MEKASYQYSEPKDTVIGTVINNVQARRKKHSGSRKPVCFPRVGKDGGCKTEFFFPRFYHLVQCDQYSIPRAPCPLPPAPLPFLACNPLIKLQTSNKIE